MAKLYLRRMPAFVDMFRAYRILVDGTDIGEIRQRQRLDFNLSPWAQQVQLVIDWCTSPTLTIDASRDVILGCQTNVTLWQTMTIPEIAKTKNWIKLWDETPASPV